MLAYIGAESISAIASGIAAFLGFLLIGWRWIRTHCKRAYRFVFRIKDDGPQDLGSDVESTEAPARSEPRQLQQNR